MRNILITGCAGFVGYHLINHIKNDNYKILGLDIVKKKKNINYERLKNLKKIKNFSYASIDITNYNKLKKYILNKKIEIIIHLAAKAGVRQSLLNTKKYFDTNVKGFYNIIEIAKEIKVDHFIYASSSSVYGDQILNNKKSLNEKLNINKPVSFYAATKTINEIISYSYSFNYSLPTTGLRFFTIYGEYGREDMSYYTFTKAIHNKEIINLYNKGNNFRDFTYVKDIAKVIKKLILKPSKKKVPFNIFNVGNSQSLKVKNFLSIIEKLMGKRTKINYTSSFKGDVVKTKSNNEILKKHINYEPNTDIKTGISKYIKWFRGFYINE